MIAGRVVPAFTISATPRAEARGSAPVEQITLALTAFALLCWVVEAPPGLTATALGRRPPTYVGSGLGGLG